MAVTQPEEASTEPPERETIEDLFAAMESPLLSYAQRLVGEFSVAEDMVQEAFMKLHAQADKIVPLNPPAQKGTERATDTTDPQPLPDEQIARWEGIGLVRLSLQTLDDRSRELIRLKFTEDLSYREISTRTGLTVGHVGYLLHHALKGIADELARNGVVP